MSNAIFKENKKFISQWISLNPNFKDLEFQNNILTYRESQIDLKTFLVSELLNNEYFINNIYIMKPNEFLNIIEWHVKSISILNPKEEKNTDRTVDYIKHIKINPLNRALVITDKENIEITDMSASDVLSKYSLLLLKYNYYVPLTELLKALNKEDEKTKSSNSFFELLSKDGVLSVSEYNYIRNVSNFIFKLNDNEHMLVGKARDLLDFYIFEINELKQVEDLKETEDLKQVKKLTPAQEYALKLFNQYMQLLEEEKKKNEESENLNSSHNYGYSSISLIITSILATGLVLIFFMMCN